MIKYLSLFFILIASEVHAQQEIPVGKLEHIIAGSVISFGSYASADIFFHDMPKIERHILAKKISISTLFTAALGRETYAYYKYKKINA